MYTFATPLETVKGIGPKLQQLLVDASIFTVGDLLKTVPLGYDDRSQLLPVAELKTQEPNAPCSIKAQVFNTSMVRRPGRTMQTATVKDESGSTKLLWFNNSFVIPSLKRGEWYYFAGKISKTGTLIQPTFERATGETLHTNRLVPRYTGTLLLKQGSLRRILKHILDDLLKNDVPEDDELTQVAAKLSYSVPTILQSLSILHFPDSQEAVPAARERLALEELISLIKESKRLKLEWQEMSTPSAQLKQLPERHESEQSITTILGTYNLPTLPFSLTAAQQKSLTDILNDLSNTQPMNRLLVGDVGSGKTIVAFLALEAIILSGSHAVLIAPTQILAEQHARKFVEQFPQIPSMLITGKSLRETPETPTCLIGTHAILSRWEQLSEHASVGLVVFDEQHRFGVGQRSELFAHTNETIPHRLTMTATPIPRSLMLTIFSHLSLSVIDELPANRLPTKTWLLPEKKRENFHEWLATEIKTGKSREKLFQAIIVCPFIDKSEQESHEHIPAATDRFAELQSWASQNQIKIALLHSRLPAKQKQTTITALFAGEIDVLVTTPIVEVGVDIPQASAMVIEAAERFGLASLHQLRGRVGRAGQQGYCALFRSPDSPSTPNKRLKLFTETNSGQELADLDLQFRGPGDLFGTQQSGFDHLQFASWTNFELIGRAKHIADHLSPDWQSFLTTHNTGRDFTLLAN